MLQTRKKLRHANGQQQLRRFHVDTLINIFTQLRGDLERVLILPATAHLTFRTLSAEPEPSWLAWDGFSSRGVPLSGDDVLTDTLAIGLPQETSPLGDLSFGEP